MSDQVQEVLLPRQFRSAGARLGDRGYISYQAPTASAIHEQRLQIAVAGFFDPGLLPIGGRLILAPKTAIEQIYSSTPGQQASIANGLAANGVELHFADLDAAGKLKQSIQQALVEASIAPYWHVQTFREYEFTKDLLQQLASERHLFSLLAMIIIVVACSNIISMLVILVNDKKQQIAILRAIGAGAGNIALIFGLCGVVMGLIGSAIGIALAMVTLQHLNSLIQFISEIQGQELFNSHFYGDKLPTELSFDALLFVSITTVAISLLSGIIPAIKAACIKPSEALKAD